MIDEEKQIDNTAQRQSDSSEVKSAMASDTTAAQINLNDNSEANAQVATQPNESAAVNEDAPPTIVAPEADYQAALSELTTQVESLKAALEERSNQYVRIGADFENFRKRTQKEKEDLEEQVKSTTITKLLPVLDNFERARSQLKPQTDAELSIHKSYQSVYKQLVDSLKSLGVSPMRPEGEEFDPNLHEALISQPTDEHPEGTILEELVRGYFLGENRRVLRHAMVKVAAAPDPGVDSEENTPSPTDS